MNDSLNPRVSSHFDDASADSSGDIIELPLLLSARQARALESVAHRRGMTAGEMVRRLLRDFISAAE